MGREAILEILREFKNKFGKKYGILSIGVFGSFAREEAGEDSDLDICVKTESPDAFALVHIKEDLENRTNRRVDLIRYRENMNQFLKERIGRECLYV
ncbi:MAG: nucleotidyltransferase domain-containing protein [Candidatus Wallbacteria bacterium]|nr:nucleotidyltransferase domain-containing protein [Candidatus Wallbacteria bacterium]